MVCEFCHNCLYRSWYFATFQKPVMPHIANLSRSWCFITLQKQLMPHIANLSRSWYFITFQKPVMPHIANLSRSWYFITFQKAVMPHIANLSRFWYLITFQKPEMPHIARHTECSQLYTTRRTTWAVRLWSGTKMRTIPTLWSTILVPSSQPWALPSLERITPTLRTRYPYLRPNLEGSAELPTCNKEEFLLLAVVSLLLFVRV
jgi:hypothetical protein